MECFSYDVLCIVDIIFFLYKYDQSLWSLTSAEAETNAHYIVKQ